MPKTGRTLGLGAAVTSSGPRVIPSAEPPDPVQITQHPLRQNAPDHLHTEAIHDDARPRRLDPACRGGPVASPTTLAHAVAIGPRGLGVLALPLAPVLWSPSLPARPLPDVDRVMRRTATRAIRSTSRSRAGRRTWSSAMLAAGWYPPIDHRCRPAFMASQWTRVAPPGRQRAGQSALPLWPQRRIWRSNCRWPGGPARRHHARYWRWDQTRDGQPVWFQRRHLRRARRGQQLHHGPGDAHHRARRGCRTGPDRQRACAGRLVGRRALDRRLPHRARGAQRRRRPVAHGRTACRGEARRAGGPAHADRLA